MRVHSKKTDEEELNMAVQMIQMMDEDDEGSVADAAADADADAVSVQSSHVSHIGDVDALGTGTGTTTQGTGTTTTTTTPTGGAPSYSAVAKARWKNKLLAIFGAVLLVAAIVLGIVLAAGNSRNMGGEEVSSASNIVVGIEQEEQEQQQQMEMVEVEVEEDTRPDTSEAFEDGYYDLDYDDYDSSPYAGGGVPSQMPSASPTTISGVPSGGPTTPPASAPTTTTTSASPTTATNDGDNDDFFDILEDDDEDDDDEGCFDGFSQMACCFVGIFC